MSTERALRLGVGFVLFQAAWFACVLGAARGQAALGIAAARREGGLDDEVLLRLATVDSAAVARVAPGGGR